MRSFVALAILAAVFVDSVPSDDEDGWHDYGDVGHKIG
jgi:hypothetical protein